MAKLEELSELLVSEIKEFEETVKKLEEIQKRKISIDITELISVLSNQEIQLKKQSSDLQVTYNKLEHLIKQAKIYPKWALIMFIASILLNGLLIFYLLLNVG